MNGNAKNNRVVILSACPVSPQMRDYLRNGDYIIACDAGYRNAAALQCSPNLVVGDFDSAPNPNFENTVILPHEKDDTDTQYAAAWAADNGAAQVLMLGALGGKRLEHTISNLSTGLYLEKRGVRAVLANEESEIHYLMSGKKLVLEKENWMYFSVFPLEGTLSGITIEGAYYPLQDAQLKMDYPLGVSNEFVQPHITLCCRQGTGIVILTKRD